LCRQCDNNRRPGAAMVSREQVKAALGS